MPRNSRIQNLVNWLSWNNSETEILQASNELEKLEGNEIRFLIQQNLDKSTWINSAKVLKRIGFPKLAPFAPALLEWFQDLNWPGVDVVAAIFKDGDKKTLLPFIENAARKAIAENDEMWVGGLKYLLTEMSAAPSELSEPTIAREIENNDHY